MVKRELMRKDRGDEGVQMHAVEILEICEEVGVKVEYMNWVSLLSFRIYLSLSQLTQFLAVADIMLRPPLPATPSTRARDPQIIHLPMFLRSRHGRVCCGRVLEEDR